MSTDDIAQKVKNVIAEVLEMQYDAIHLNASLDRDLEASSFNIIWIVTTLERAFGIKIPNEDVLKFFTVQDIVTYIESHRP